VEVVEEMPKKKKKRKVEMDDDEVGEGRRTVVQAQPEVRLSSPP